MGLDPWTTWSLEHRWAVLKRETICWWVDGPCVCVGARAHMGSLRCVPKSKHLPHGLDPCGLIMQNQVQMKNRFEDILYLNIHQYGKKCTFPDGKVHHGINLWKQLHILHLSQLLPFTALILKMKEAESDCPTPPQGSWGTRLGKIGATWAGWICYVMGGFMRSSCKYSSGFPLLCLEVVVVYSHA